MSIYSNDNIRKIAKLTTRELPQKSKNAKITVRENNGLYSTFFCKKKKLKAAIVYFLIHLGLKPIRKAPKMARPQYTPQQRSFMVTEFHRTESVTAVLRRFREVYPDVRCPSRFAVYKNVAKYQATGSSLNQNVGRSGCTRSARSAANVAAVRNVLETHEDGTISSRRNGLGLPHSTFNRITRLDLDFHPYQMIKWHELLPGDRQRRSAFCQWLLARPARFLDDLLIGDESGFAMNAMVNTHNLLGPIVYVDINLMNLIISEVTPDPRSLFGPASWATEIS